MARHRFQIGDQVRWVGSTSANSAEALIADHVPRDVSTLWTVERLLPEDGHGFQYRIRSPEGTTRLVHERDIETV